MSDMQREPTVMSTRFQEVPFPFILNSRGALAYLAPMAPIPSD
jgi:hypothetical protein